MLIFIVGCAVFYVLGVLSAIVTLSLAKAGSDPLIVFFGDEDRDRDEEDSIERG